MGKALDDSVHDEITDLCAKGDEFLDDDSFKDALIMYRQAFDLVPEPKYDWEASTWILTAIADTYFYSENYKEAKEVIEYLMHCPDAIGNAYIHLRKGQIHFELSEFDKAKDELLRAYMGGGDEIFEDDAPKYKALIEGVTKETNYD